MIEPEAPTPEAPPRAYEEPAPYEPTWPEKRPLTDALLLGSILMFAYFVRQLRLAFPPKRYFDETYYVRSAYEYLQGQHDSNTVHPPLGKMIIAAWMQVYDGIAVHLDNLGLLDGVSDGGAWRFGSLLAGLGIIAVTYALGFRLFRSRFVGAAAAFLLAIDPLHLVQSRIAMLDMYLALFVLLGAYAAWRFIESSRQRFGWAVASAVFFGIGAACKWSSMFATVGAVAAMLLLSPRLRWTWALKLFAIYAVIVPLLYLSAFIPFFYQGQTRQKLYDNHKLMWTFRHGAEFKHRYMSEFWEWPILKRPVWYHYEEYKEPRGSVFPAERDTPLSKLMWRNHEGTQYISGVIAIGSPFVWATFLIFYLLTLGQSLFVPLAVTLQLWWRGRKPPPPSEGAPARQPHEARTYFDAWRLGMERPWLFLVLLYTPQVLLWKLNRGFFFYMLPCTPFMALLVAAVVREWQELSWGKTCVALYLVAALLCMAIYYPLLTGYPIPRPYYDLLIPPPISKFWV